MNSSLNFLQLLPDFYQQLKELVCCVPMPVSWLLNWANCPHLGLILVCLVCSCSQLSPSWSSWSTLADFLPVVVQLSSSESGDPPPVFIWSERDPTVPSNWTMDTYNWKETKNLIRKEMKSKSMSRSRKVEL